MSDTFDLIDGQFKKCQEYAETAVEALLGVDGYIERIIQEAGSDIPQINIEDIEVEWPDPTISPDIQALRPDAPNIVYTNPAVPTKPTLNEVTLPELPTIPSLQAVFPELSTISPPDPTLPVDPGSPPAFEYPDMPIKPPYTLPEFPELAEIQIPAMPTIDMPQFEGVLPVSDLGELEVQFIYDEAPYRSDVFDQMRAKLLAAFADGGTGLSPEVEEAIWRRARERAQLNVEKHHNEAMNFWASRGYTLPPGALSARLLEAFIEQSRAEADINDKILIQSSNLAQEFEKFYMTTAVQFEQQMRDYQNQVANRTLEAAKAAVQAGIDIYNAKIAKYNAEVEIYKTMASVFEARIRGATLELEAYRISMEAARVAGELNSQRVEIYKAQIGAVTSAIELFKAEMQAAAARTDIDRLRLDAFKATVDIYSTKIQAKTAEYNLYQAQLAGDQAKIELYSEQVKAYAVEMDGAKTHLEAIRTEVTAKTEVNKQLLDVYTSDIEKYKADAQVESTKVESLVKVYDSQVKAYEADIKLGELDLTAQVEAYKGKLEEARNKATLLLKQAEIELQAFIHNRDLSAEAIKSAAALLAQLAAAALSAINASASGGYHLNESWDRTRAVPTFSTSHQYMYSE